MCGAVIAAAMRCAARWRRGRAVVAAAVVSRGATAKGRGRGTIRSSKKPRMTTVRRTGGVGKRAELPLRSASATRALAGIVLVRCCCSGSERGSLRFLWLAGMRPEVLQEESSSVKRA